MITEEEALLGFGQGISCAMAVFGEMAECIGLDKETARKLAAGFGGGAGMGGICGCVSAAYMVLGYKYGAAREGDVQQQMEFAQKKAEFNNRFKEMYGSLVCKEMLGGLNPSIPEEKAEIGKQGLMQSTCAPAVCAAIDILKEILEVED